MQITKATKNDLPEILELLRLLVIQMRENGLYFWNDNYPFSAIAKDIANQHLYKISEKESTTILGIIVLNEEQDPNYKNLTWQFHGKILVVHRLAVHPMAQKRGIAHQLMEFAEQFAKENQYNAIRLDVYHKSFALDFYKKRQFLEVGHVILNPKVEYFVCFEKPTRRSTSQDGQPVPPQ